MIVEGLLFLCLAIAVFLTPVQPTALLALRVIGLILTALFILECFGVLDGLRLGRLR